MKKKYYPAIDIMKLVCAILVIIVHTNPLQPYFPLANFILINVFGRVSVPFFFLSSGYLFAQNLKSKGNDYFKTYIWSLIRLYLIWFVIYIPFGLMRIHEMVPGEISPLLWIGVFFEALFLHGSYFHLWYLAALILGLIMVYFFQKHFKMKYLILIGIVLFIIGLSETYNDVVNLIPGISNVTDFYFKWFFTTRNAVFFGLVFLAIGFELYNREETFRINNAGKWSVVCFILLFVEAILLRYLSVPLNYNLLIMQLPFTVCFFEFLKSERFAKIKVSRKLRAYNTWFYLTHAMFLELIPICLRWLQQSDLWELGWFRFITVMVCTYLVSNLIIYVSDKKRQQQKRV